MAELVLHLYSTDEPTFNDAIALNLPSDLQPLGSIKVLRDRQDWNNKVVKSSFKEYCMNHNPTERGLDELAERLNCKWGKWMLLYIGAKVG